MHPVYHLSSDNFLMYPRTLRGNGCCSDQQSFHQLLKVVGENGLEWRAIVGKEHLGESCGQKRLRMAGDSEKITPWWNQEVKEAIRAKKDALRPGYRTDRHLICNPGTLRREKRRLRQ